MRMTKGCLFAVAISVAFLGSCKSKSNSKLRDIDVMPDGNEGLFVFGLQEGLVKYRMCSPEEMQKMADSKVLSGSLDTCTAKVPAWPDGNKRLDYYYPDIAEADYKTLLCKQLGYDEKDFLNTQVEFGTIERDIAQATSRLEENNAKLKSETAAKARETLTGLIAEATEAKKTLDAKRKVVFEKMISLGEKSQECERMMDQWVKPPEKLVDDAGNKVSRGRKTLYWKSKEHGILYTPFEIVAKSKSDSELEKVVPSLKVNNNVASSKSVLVQETLEIPLKDKLINCRFDYLSTTYNINDWYSYWIQSCQLHCKSKKNNQGDCINYRMIDFSYKSNEKSPLTESKDRCDIKFEFKCKEGTTEN